MTGLEEAKIRALENFRAAGLLVDNQIADGKIHRCPVSGGKPGSMDGAYKIHTDEPFSWWFQNHKTGEKGTGSLKATRQKPMSKAERQARSKGIEENRRAEQGKRDQKYAETAKKARAIYDAASSNGVAENPYLRRKGVNKPIPGLKLSTEETTIGGVTFPKGSLIVPVYDENGNLCSLQYIHPTLITGNKRFLKGGKKGFFTIGKDAEKPLLIAEGLATGLSLYECTSNSVRVAFDAGHLKAAAEFARRLYPESEIVLCADFDDRSEQYPNLGGIGLAKATEAALAVDGSLAVPYGTTKSDFNDMHRLMGAKAVRVSFENRIRREAVRRRAVAIKKGPSLGKETAHNATKMNVGDTTQSIPVSQEGSWPPEPEPIPDALLPVQLFSYDLLPDSLRSWVRDIVERMQCPADFVAVAVITVLSSLIGRVACIRPKRFDNWKVFPNLWGLVIGRPGIMKSPPIAEVMKPVYVMESKARKEFEEELQNYELETAVDKLRRKEAEKQAKDVGGKEGWDGDEARRILKESQDQTVALQRPVQRRYIVTDSTVEALADILLENPLGLLVYRDELYGLLCSLDKQGQEGSRSFYLQGYDGDKAWTADRIGRGKYLYVHSVCIAMLGAIQPGRLAEYISAALTGGSGDDGLIQRFGLAVWPDISPDWENVDRPPNGEAEDKAIAVYKQLANLHPDTDKDGQPRPHEYRFAAGAQDRFDSWREGLEHELRSREGNLHPALEGHLAKYRKLIPALALVIGLADGEEKISEESLLKALAWGEYLRSHAERMYAAGTRPDVNSAKALLAKIKEGKVRDGFAINMVYHKGWSELADAKTASAAAEFLVTLGHLRKIEHPATVKGGRPTVRYLIHPMYMPDSQGHCERKAA